jgi:glycerophosphoryl diester phosphodiesterase/predicted amidohydrolase
MKLKVCTVQPPYSADHGTSEANFKKTVELLDGIDPSADLIVLPEACDVPALARTPEQRRASFDRFHGPLLEAASRTAVRCGARVFFGGYSPDGDRMFNTVFMADRDGRISEVYRKQHLTPGEVRKLGFDDGKSYIWQSGWPDAVTVDGIRLAFLVCYDFYFYEAFPVLARMEPDIIIGCSHQRSDMHSALETSVRFLAYNTNAYVVRSSVSMGEDSELGGCSVIATPRGELLENLGSRVGVAYAEIDTSVKYEKTAGFGGSVMPHWKYVDAGRRPWKYRPAGPFICPPDAHMAYPRLCAHRGFKAVAPENSLPAYGAAVALGASEIEFDLWETKDGEIVSLHDKKLDRTSDGTGYVWDYTYEELLKFDFGSKFSESFSGLRILRFEEILKKFACQTVMNIHVKPHTKTEPEDEGKLRRIAELIRRYDCTGHAYFMSGNDAVVRQLREIAPDIPCCMGAGKDPWAIVERAKELGCCKVQLFKPYFNREMIEEAHRCGIRCNVYWADDPEEARTYLDMGVDTVLTNDYQRMTAALGIS